MSESMSIADKIVFLKKEIAESEEYVKECKKALRIIAKQAWDEGIRDAGDFEVREIRPADLNVASLRTAYPDIYEGVVDALTTSFIPDVTKTAIRRYLEEEHYNPTEIERIIDECSEPRSYVSYYVYRKGGEKE